MLHWPIGSHSRAQSFSSSLSAVGRREKLWDNGISWNILWIFDRLFAEQQPIKKFKKYSKKFHYPRVTPGDQLLTKKPEDAGFGIDRLQINEPAPTNCMNDCLYVWLTVWPSGWIVCLCPCDNWLSDLMTDWLTTRLNDSGLTPPYSMHRLHAHWLTR